MPYKIIISISDILESSITSFVEKQSRLAPLLVIEISRDCFIEIFKLLFAGKLEIYESRVVSHES